ncbi:MATE family efflux transporter [Treponema rectale]|uniref:MATE family efflux transporter n=1 Tax=Treponema rectale TaxID=744512 RepID=A0A840SAJ5_9SPIR|nr:MATE family efflux transporter [Treponema rectale]MBB5217824.1 putative MATE family efflux protein [Treponema rectale]QOS40450.1 MATE family efflux transporter [Treponema rectale]
MTKLNDVFEHEFLHKLFKLALPIAFQSLMLSAVAACDAIMLGNVEQNMMSAVSLATQIQFIQNMIVFAVIGAESILGAQYFGKNDFKSLNDIFLISIRINSITCIIFFVLCEFFPENLMLIFTNEPELIKIGAGYLRIAAWSYLITGVSQCYLAMMKITDHAFETAKISAGTVILNIFLNAVFIFGLFGFEKMNVRGAALATLISRIVELVWSVGASFKKEFVAPDYRKLFTFNKVLEKDFAKCTLPLLGASLFWGTGFTSYTAFMGHLGKDAAAANSVASVVRDLVCCFCNGLASGGGILVGTQLGAGELEKGKSYGDRLLIIAFVFGFASTAIMLALTPLVLDFVRLTPEARKLLIGMMIIMAVYMIGRTVNSILINGIFDCGGDTLFDVYSLAVCMWGIAVPLAAAGTFLFNWPILLIYACTCLDEVGKIPWVLHHYRKYKWVKDLTR